jgi:16S rRNA (uracil1498-N3)-methyltransferase
MTTRLYCPLRLATGAVVDLPEAAAHHAARVLRLRDDDEITLFNGDGGEFAARIARVDAGAVAVNVGQFRDIDRDSPLLVTLIQGLATGDRMDYTIQKAVELGVAAVQPVTTARSVARLDAPRAEKRILHWRQIAISACEQCGRNRIPEVLPLQDIEHWLLAPTSASLRLLLAPEGQRALAQMIRPSGSIEFLVGPEGGLAPEETAAALRAGFTAVRLGPRILRTETAALAALAALNTMWGDWR